jgi:hypothetical protein
MKQITWINLILGIWLIIAPFAIGYSSSGAATWNDIVLGILLVAFAWWTLAAIAAPIGVAWFQVFCGIWLVVAPFVLAPVAGSSGTINDIVCGIVAIVIGVIGSRALARTPAV